MGYSWSKNGPFGPKENFFVLNFISILFFQSLFSSKQKQNPSRRKTSTWILDIASKFGIGRNQIQTTLKRKVGPKKEYEENQPSARKQGIHRSVNEEINELTWD